MNKKIVLSIALLLGSTGMFAQTTNPLLDKDFWSKHPDVATVKATIGQGNSYLDVSPMAFDAATTAILNGGSFETIKFLLEQPGNPVDKPTHDGRSYIFWAAVKNNMPVVEYLIQKGANVNLEDSHGATVLSFIAGKPVDPGIYELLIKAGADLHKKYANGANLLLMAVPNDNELKFTDYLISKGLSLQSVDDNGATAFDYAARTGNIDNMKHLLKRGVKYTDNALIMASEGSFRSTNKIDVYEYLINLGIKPSVTGSNGDNVLHNIVKKGGQEDIIRFFMDKGVDVNQPDHDGNTPFMNACASNKDISSIKLLLPAVKDINRKNKTGVSALAFAVKGNTAEAVALLLDKGADIQTKDNAGNTLAYYLLESAAAGGRGGRGNNSGGGAPQGGNAPQRSEGKGRSQSTDEGQREGNGKGGEHTAASPDDIFMAKVRLLKDKGLNYAAPQEGGNSLIILAAAKNDLSLLRHLQGLGININAQNAEGLTALHQAALVSKDDTVLKYLVEQGADKSLKTDMGETAYDLAKDNEYLTKRHIAVDFLK